MAQTQEIYAHLLVCVDAAISLLLGQELADAEFIKAANQRIFTKLGAVQEAATLQCSRLASVQEAGLRLSNVHNVPNDPIRPGDEADLSSISGRSVTCVSDNAVHLDDAGGVAPIPDSTNSPRTPSDVLCDPNTPRDEVLHVRSDTFHMLECPSDEVSEQYFPESSTASDQTHPIHVPVSAGGTL
jgi:hypothetical protein